MTFSLARSAARPQLRRAALCGPVFLNMVDAYEVYAALGDG